MLAGLRIKIMDLEGLMIDVSRLAYYAHLERLQPSKSVLVLKHLL